MRTRSPENVVAELVDLHERYGVRYVGFKDDQFAVKPDWQEPFLAQLTERQLDIKWSCLVHPYNFRRNREEKLRRFRDAGCDLLSFGLQAVDPKILKGIRRSTEEPRELAENVRVAAVKVCTAYGRHGIARRQRFEECRSLPLSLTLRKTRKARGAQM